MTPAAALRWKTKKMTNCPDSHISAASIAPPESVPSHSAHDCTKGFLQHRRERHCHRHCYFPGRPAWPGRNPACRCFHTPGHRRHAPAPRLSDSECSKRRDYRPPDCLRNARRYWVQTHVVPHGNARKCAAGITRLPKQKLLAGNARCSHRTCRRRRPRGKQGEVGGTQIDTGNKHQLVDDIKPHHGCQHAAKNARY